MDNWMFSIYKQVFNLQFFLKIITIKICFENKKKGKLINRVDNSVSNTPVSCL